MLKVNSVAGSLSSRLSRILFGLYFPFARVRALVCVHPSRLFIYFGGEKTAFFLDPALAGIPIIGAGEDSRARSRNDFTGNIRSARKARLVITRID